MNIRLVAGSMAIGLLCLVALFLFAPRSAPELLTAAEYERAITAWRKRPDATGEFVATCLPLMEPELKESDLKGTSFKNQTELARDICHRFINVVLDGRLTLAEINRYPGGLPFKLVEEAERRRAKSRNE